MTILCTNVDCNKDGLYHIILRISDHSPDAKRTYFWNTDSKIIHVCLTHYKIFLLDQLIGLDKQEREKKLRINDNDNLGTTIIDPSKLDPSPVGFKMEKETEEKIKEKERKIKEEKK